MAIDALATWKTFYNALPLVDSGIWTTNFSNWGNNRVVNKAQVTGVTHASPPFLFAVATWKTQLDALTDTDDKTAAATAFADAWETAINASSLTTLPGDFVNPGGDPTLIWSSISSSIIDASSITAARSQMIADILAADDAATLDDSKIPEIIRDAFLALTCTITGQDSSTPTTLPLNVTGAALI